jgi:hypothetical protein
MVNHITFNKIARYIYLCGAIFVLQQLGCTLLIYADNPPPQADGRTKPVEKPRFIGRAIGDVEKVLGAPVRSPDKLANGRLYFLFTDNRADEIARKTQNHDPYVSGWTIIVENGIVVDEQPNFGQLVEQGQPPPWAPKYFAQFMVVSTAPQEGAIKVPVPGEADHEYFYSVSSPICEAGIENIDIKWNRTNNKELSIRMLLLARYADRLRKFSAEEKGQLVILLINYQPIAVASLGAEIDTGDFETTKAASPDLIEAFGKLGLHLPAQTTKQGAEKNNGNQ